MPALKRGSTTIHGLTLGLLLALATAAVLQGSQDKLVDLARKFPDGEFITNREISPADLPDLVRASDLIARVLVQDGRSRLSEDERSIETDYSVQVLDAYVGNSPGAGLPIIVTKPGGVLALDGRKIVSSETDFPPLEIGGEYVLFLSREPRSSRFAIAYGGQGAFREEGGTVEQVSKNNGKFRDERGKVPSLDFAQEIKAAAAERR